jgi:hypothetical protein
MDMDELADGDADAARGARLPIPDATSASERASEARLPAGGRVIVTSSDASHLARALSLFATHTGAGTYAGAGFAGKRVELRTSSMLRTLADVRGVDALGETVLTIKTPLAMESVIYAEPGAAGLRRTASFVPAPARTAVLEEGMRRRSSTAVRRARHILARGVDCADSGREPERCLAVVLMQWRFVGRTGALVELEVELQSRKGAWENDANRIRRGRGDGEPGERQKDAVAEGRAPVRASATRIHAKGTMNTHGSDLR